MCQINGNFTFGWYLFWQLNISISWNSERFLTLMLNLHVTSWQNSFNAVWSWSLPSEKKKTIDLNGATVFNPLPHLPILGSSNSAPNKHMMRKIWGKWGYNYLIEQFLLFPKCFQKLSFVDASKWVSMEQRVISTKLLRLVLIVSICRWRNNGATGMDIYFLKGTKPCWKKEKILLASIFAFSHIVWWKALCWGCEIFFFFVKC